jgi:hypothetical protein
MNAVYLGDGDGGEGVFFGSVQEIIVAYDTTADALELDGGLISIGDDPGGSLATADDELYVVGDAEFASNVEIEDELYLGRQTYAVTDDGVANDTLTPTTSYVELEQDATANVGTPDVVLSETAAVEGEILVIVRNDAAAGDVTINEVDGANEQAGAATLNVSEFDSIMYIYTGTTWVELARSNNG